MNCMAWHAKLDSYMDRQLAPAETCEFEAHVDECATCRREIEGLRRLQSQIAVIPSEIPPQRDLWPLISTALVQRSKEHSPVSDNPEDFASSHARVITGRRGATDVVVRWFLPLGLAAAIALIISLVRPEHTGSGLQPPWSVAALDGVPRVGRTRVQSAAPFRVGEWLETDAASRARVTVAAIGEVTLDPNSRLRLVNARDTDHRLELARGSLHAFIWAPPRIFFVDTPSATAVDLGCAYTLTVADNGDGELRVTSGYVALEHGGRESIIPASAMCLTRRGSGPGTPFANDAPDALRAALKRFDFERAAAGEVIPIILAQARAEDAVTLWHLLARTKGAERAAVFDLLARHHAPPANVTRDGILAGDAKMRQAWGERIGVGTF